MFKKIAIAYDESPSSENALTAGISLAATLGSTLRIITVIEPQPSLLNMSLAIDPKLPERLANERRDRLKQVQELAIRHAADAGVAADGVLIDGPEVETILVAVTAYNAELLVIGRAQQHEYFSTLHRIGMQVTCPILAVH